MSANDANNTPHRGQDWIDLVRQRVANLRYGHLTITVHDGHVIQIDTNQQIHLANGYQHRRRFAAVRGR